MRAERLISQIRDAVRFFGPIAEVYWRESDDAELVPIDRVIWRGGRDQCIVLSPKRPKDTL